MTEFNTGSKMLTCLDSARLVHQADVDLWSRVIRCPAGTFLQSFQLGEVHGFVGLYPMSCQNNHRRLQSTTQATEHDP